MSEETTRMDFATAADGFKIAYVDRGSGPAVLLLHGFASSAEQNWISTGWLRTLGEAGFRVLAPDFRGHGHSDKPHDPSAYGAKMMLDIEVVLAAAGVGAVSVIGYSMGGMMGMHLLLDHPERVDKLIVAGVGERYLAAPLSYVAIAEALEAEDEDSIVDPVGRRFRRFASQKGKDRLALAACMRSRQHRASAADLGERLHAVLVVCGDADDVSGPPEHLAAVFKFGRALRLPGRDHMSAVGDAAFKRAAVDFLGGTPVSPWSSPVPISR